MMGWESTGLFKNANWTNTYGSSGLGMMWTDPDFNLEQRASYYAGVLEIPMPRWGVYEAFRYGVEIPEGAKTIGQEPANTSPIREMPGS